MLGRAVSDDKAVAIRSWKLGAQVAPIAIATGVLLGVVGAWWLGQMLVLDVFAPRRVEALLPSTSQPLWPDARIDLVVRGAGTELASLNLYRTDLDATRSKVGAEQEVPVSVSATGDGVFAVRGKDGGTPLEPDGTYRLVVRSIAPVPGLLLPQPTLVERQYRFDTVAASHPELPNGVLQPKWGDPVELTWSKPLAHIQATLQPRAPVRAWVDQSDPRRTWIQIGAPLSDAAEGGQVYQVTVAHAQGVDGLELLKPPVLKIAIPARPRAVDPPTQPVTLGTGEDLVIRFSTDLASARVEAGDGVQLASTVSGNAVHVKPVNFQQGAAFTVKVTQAVSKQGAPLAAPVSVQVLTPRAIPAPTANPQRNATAVPPSTHPSLTFQDPVTDRASVVRALTLEPRVSGSWRWTSPTQVEFVPGERLPSFADFTLTLHGGPDGPRTADGGYLEENLVVPFHTSDFKRIDVNLSKQQMVLLEDDQPVRTVAVATGVRGAETPPGNYDVLYKMPVARFKGVNPSGSHYDIPDVHWVMAFYGDYTIHGAYWRSQFGTPGSAGCVSLTDANAKVVYDWADVGTPITIHY